MPDLPGVSMVVPHPTRMQDTGLWSHRTSEGFGEGTYYAIQPADAAMFNSDRAVRSAMQAGTVPAAAQLIRAAARYGNTLDPEYAKTLVGMYRRSARDYRGLLAEGQRQGQHIGSAYDFETSYSGAPSDYPYLLTGDEHEAPNAYRQLGEHAPDPLEILLRQSSVLSRTQSVGGFMPLYMHMVGHGQTTVSNVMEMVLGDRSRFHDDAMQGSSSLPSLLRGSLNPVFQDEEADAAMLGQIRSIAGGTSNLERISRRLWASRASQYRRPAALCGSAPSCTTEPGYNAPRNTSRRAFHVNVW